MANKGVNIKIKADGSQAKKEIESVNSKLDVFSKVGNVATGLKSSFDIVTNAVSKFSDTIKELIDLSNTQAQAELQLEVAAKNNPYLNDENVQQLKDYAGYLQSIGVVGDESLLPMMAKLAASGRNQAEIQSIMATALDMSASGTVALDTAVSSLNKTFSGSAGLLAKEHTELKNLTEEELKQGKAIEILGGKYKGMSQTVTEARFGWTQAMNSLGDLKEVLGNGFAKLQNAAGHVLVKFFDSVTNKIKSAGNEADKFKQKLNIIATAENENTKKSVENEITFLEDQIKTLNNIKIVNSDNGIENFTKQAKNDLSSLNNEINTQIDNFNKSIIELNQKSTQLQESQYRELQAALFSGNSSQADEIKEKYKLQINENLKQIKTIENERQKYVQETNGRLAEQKLVVKNVKAEAQSLTDIFNRDYMGSISVVNKELEETEKQLAKAKKDLNQLNKNANSQTQREEERKAAEERKKNAQAQMEERDRLRASYDESIRQAKSQIAQERALGHEIDEVTEAQRLLNIAESEYIAMMSSKAFEGNAGTYAHEVNARKYILELAEKAKVQVKEEILSYKDLQDVIDKYAGQTNDELKKQLSLQKESLEYLLSQGNLTEEESERVVRAIKGIEEALENVGKVKITSPLEDLTKTLDAVQSVYGNIADSISEISNIAVEKAEAEATIETDKLDKQLEAGVISYEEYEKKKQAIEKDAAKKEYQAKMWSWSASLLEIGTNTALAITKALATDGLLGPVLAASIGVLGATQLASAIANKPIPPSYATGGIVGGSSFYGDKIQANVNSGEMILNSQQQKELWNLANGNSKANGLQVKINNYIGETANVSTQMQNGQLEVIIKGVVNNGLNSGDFDSGILSAQNRQGGVSYTS